MALVWWALKCGIWLKVSRAWSLLEEIADKVLEFPAYLEQDIRVEGKSGYKIDEVNGRLQKLEFVGADDEAYANFQSEPYVAAQLHEEKSLVRICQNFSQQLTPLRSLDPNRHHQWFHTQPKQLRGHSSTILADFIEESWTFVGSDSQTDRL